MASPKKKDPVVAEFAELPQELTSCLMLIQELLEEKGYVRGVELAERLELSRPTVTRAIQRLAALGFANYERYRGITLSAAGFSAAEEAKRRFSVVRSFLEATHVPMGDMQMESRRLAASVSDEVLAAFEVASTRLAD